MPSASAPNSSVRERLSDSVLSIAVAELVHGRSVTSCAVEYRPPITRSFVMAVTFDNPDALFTTHEVAEFRRTTVGALAAERFRGG